MNNRPNNPQPPPPPVPDYIQLPDEAMEGQPIDLLEYLERQDNPDPDYHPPVNTDADARNNPPLLPPGEPQTPPGRSQHVHEDNWTPPSLKPIYRQEGRRQKLQDSGILNFIAYNYPKVERSSINTEWRDIRWSESENSIVVTPRLPGTDFSPRLDPPGRVITTEYLQKIWPGLPSMDSHPSSILAMAPDHNNEDFMKEAVGRFVALTAMVEEDNLYPAIFLDPCFHKPFHRLLLRIAYIFGWRGYPVTFPTRYYPMAVSTFASGGHLAWADLLHRELIHDVKHRRPFPRMVRVWKVIHKSVALGTDGPPPYPLSEKRYNYETLLQQCMRENVPYIWYFHYHVPEISQWTPDIVRDCVERGACDNNESFVWLARSGKQLCSFPFLFSLQRHNP